MARDMNQICFDIASRPDSVGLPRMPRPARTRSDWLAQTILPHEPELRSWLRRKVVSGLEVDDVVQETYAVLSSLPRVDHIEAPKAYLFRAAQSIVLRHMRRARIVRIDAMDDVETLSIPVDAPSQDKEVAAREELRRVRSLVATLPQKCRQAFTLRKFHDVPLREIAAAMGISEKTVEKHITHGLRTLTAAMSD